MRRARTHREAGLTLVELLVSLSIFSTIGLSLVSFTTSALGTMSVESRASLAAQELRNGLAMFSTELRMSTSISPYIVGNSSSVVTCSSSYSLTSTKVKFLVVQDEPTASTSGIQPYYVGYWYDSSTQQLLRGEIAGNSITNCTLPAGDPASSATAKILAENVIQIDGDGNGTVDPAFVTSGNSIVVNLGIQVKGANGLTIVQPMPLTIYRRTV